MITRAQRDDALDVDALPIETYRGKHRAANPVPAARSARPARTRVGYDPTGRIGGPRPNNRACTHP